MKLINPRKHHLTKADTGKKETQFIIAFVLRNFPTKKTPGTKTNNIDFTWTLIENRKQILLNMFCETNITDTSTR